MCELNLMAEEEISPFVIAAKRVHRRAEEEGLATKKFCSEEGVCWIGSP